MSVEIDQRDALEWLRSRPEGAADAIITDPPYGATDCAWDHAPDWREYWPLMARALKPSGVVIIFNQFPPLLDLFPSAPKSFPFRHELIWFKNVPVGMLNAGRVPLRQHENILVFAGPRYTFNPQTVYVPGAAPIEGGRRKRGDKIADVYHGMRHKSYYSKERAAGERCMSDVIRASRDETAFHPTQKPQQLMRLLVRAYTNAGDLVLDPFAGSGSTLLAAMAERRNAAGSELNGAYVQTIRNRIAAETLPFQIDLTNA
ncbi:MAG: site-specific DNA-methyltransferase [Akkermansiaceae bacterium]|nr:site-specific DNA-methyltransferase [Akkermansiaceae bacterium]